MVTVTLKRLETSDEGTFGKLITKGLSLFTGELPWRENRPNVSCIPQGLYRCEYVFSPRFGRFMYGLVSVPGRSGVRVHSANFVGAKDQGFRTQLNGCVSLGEKLGWLDKQKALLLSAPAVRKFESHMERKPFLLEVIDV